MSHDAPAGPAGADEHVAILRVELKQWEKAFADANGGRKAERADIKSDPAIAQKYKEYDKVRGRKSLPKPPHPDVRTPAKRKRPIDDDHHERPGEKSSKHASSLSARGPTAGAIASPPPQARLHPAGADPFASPQRAAVTPTAFRTSIGPTPQRDGYALGIFDVISPPQLPGLARTPSKTIPPSPARPTAAAQATPSKPIGTTPRKSAGNASERQTLGTPRSAEKSGASARPPAAVSTPLKSGGAATPAGRPSRTPLSTGRRHFLDAFLATPSARRGARPGLNARSLGLVRAAPPDDVEAAVAAATDTLTTPSRKRRADSSPRGTLFAIPEQDAEGKENGRADEDADPPVSLSPVAVRLLPKPIGRPLSALVQGLRDMEAEREEEDMDILRELEAEWEGTALETAHAGAPSAGKQPSQIGKQADTADANKNDKNKQSGDGKTEARVWKKKGQKRTTRNVRIRPSTAKWKPEPEWKGGVESEGESDGFDESKVEPDGDFEDGPASPSRDNTEKAEPQQKDEKKPGRGRPPKKIAATAHPNFRALKIKNKNSKAKRGRFGRRR